MPYFEQGNRTAVADEIEIAKEIEKKIDQLRKKIRKTKDTEEQKKLKKKLEDLSPRSGIY